MPSRWTLRAAAVVLGLSALAFGAGLIGFIRMSHARQASLREWNAQRCSVYRSTFAGADDPCDPVPRGEPIITTLRAVRADTVRARLAIGAGDDATAARELARALDRAAAVERRSSFFATAIAARGAAEILDVIDARPSLATRPELRAALARTALSTAHRPLEADRLRAARDTLDGSPRTAFLTWGATDARVADEVEREDALMLSMQRDARAGDLEACERTGAKTRVGPYICPALVRTIATAQRLDRARDRSARAARASLADDAARARLVQHVDGAALVDVTEQSLVETEAGKLPQAP